MATGPPDASTDKTSWRRWARDLPEAPPPVQAAVRTHLVGFLAHRRGLIAIYDALAGEIDVAGVVDSDVETAVPRLEGGVVTWHRLTREPERHPLGFLQPVADEPALDPGSFVAVLVPGRVFDRLGFRLGRGGGHYDRLVSLLRPNCAVIGVTTSSRIVPRLPVEAHDRPMTHLATESGVMPIS